MHIYCHVHTHIHTHSNGYRYAVIQSDNDASLLENWPKRFRYIVSSLIVKAIPRPMTWVTVEVRRKVGGHERRGAVRGARRRCHGHASPSAVRGRGLDGIWPLPDRSPHAPARRPRKGSNLDLLCSNKEQGEDILAAKCLIMVVEAGGLGWRRRVPQS